MNNNLISKYSFFEHSQSPTIIVDVKKKKFVYFNIAAHKKLGYTRKEFLKLTAQDIIDAESLGKFKKSISTPTLKNIPNSFEILQKIKDSKLIHAIAKVKYADCNENKSVLCILLDISRLMRIEEQLIESDVRPI
jgi:PAS domain S-box-containing protein